MIRSIFDGLVNRLNEYRYELTVKLRIPSTSETMVKNCLEEFQTTIIPYVQRTCCENDVKQEDVNRIQMFIDKMQTVIQRIHFHWDEIEREKSNKRTLAQVGFSSLSARSSTGVSLDFRGIRNG